MEKPLLQKGLWFQALPDIRCLPCIITWPEALRDSPVIEMLDTGP